MKKPRIAWKPLSAIASVLAAATAMSAPKINSMPRPFDAGTCEGTSYFEKAIADSGGKIADDLEGITQQIKSSLKAPVIISGIDVSDSRSLERDHTSLDSLRTLIAIQRQEKTAPNTFGGATPEDRMPPCSSQIRPTPMSWSFRAGSPEKIVTNFFSSRTFRPKRKLA